MEQHAASPWLSIIIPTLDEAENLRRLLPWLRAHVPQGEAEILVSDAGSRDGSLEAARACGADEAFCSPQPGRAAQMNHAAQRARGRVLYFVHADTLPPPSFAADIRQALAEGCRIGGYRFRFDSRHPMLRLNAWFTRFPVMICRGGDQSLFLERGLFEALGGYPADFRIMEEYELIRRARRHSRFRIMDGDTLVSARKYERNSYARVNLANLSIFLLYYLGVPQQRLAALYRQMLDYRREHAPRQQQEG
jgi:rSAM/selenodomain-associated transferase 2